MPLIPGYIFEEDEQVTAEKIRLAFVNGTASGLTQANISAGVATPQASAPAPGIGRLWPDTSNGNGRMTLRMFDGFDWVAVAEAFIGFNGSGTTIGAGSLVENDITTTTSITGARVAVKKTNAQTDLPSGVSVNEILSGDFGVIQTRGKCKILKDATAITVGDGVAPSSGTAGQATTTAGGGWGQPYGSSAIGTWLVTSSDGAGTLTDAILTGPGRASWMAFKSAPALLINAVAPSAKATWQTAVAWSASPPGVTAHLAQVRMQCTLAITTEQFVIGLRANGSSLTIDTGAAFLSGHAADTGGGLTTGEGLRGTLWVPQGSDNTFQWYLDISGAATAAQINLTLHEVGVIAGGQVI